MEPPRHVYFLTAGLASLAITAPDGETSEVSLIGREGLIGNWLALGPAQGNLACSMHMRGSALRLPLAEFQAAFAESPEIRARALEFAHFQFNMLAQLTLCRGHHDLRQRLARWLLMAEDRTGYGLIEMTQEAMASTLGTQRSTLTHLLGTLESEGLLEVSRGCIRLLQRPGLIAAACPCYSVAQSSYKQLYQTSFAHKA